MSERNLLSARVASASLALLLMLPLPASAFHFPWDQGHDTCRPNAPPPPPDTCDKCNTNPSPYVAATGAYTTVYADIFIPGRMPLEVIRTYHSRDPHNGMFGRGWLSNYGFRLIEVTDGLRQVVIVRRPDGHRDRFDRASNGTYQSPADVFDVLTRNPDGTWEMRDREGTDFHFDDVGVLTSIIDRNGNSVTLNYDAVGALSEIVDDDGRVLTLTKGANGKIADVTDPAGRTTSYDYDTEGRLTAVTNPRGFTTSYGYDTDGNLTSIVNPEGEIIETVAYDDLGRLIGYMEMGETYTLVHKPVERTVLETDSRGNTRTIIYNANGNIVSKTDGAGNVEQVGYDADFNPAVLTDKNGNVTLREFDAQGNITKIIDPEGNETQLSYEPVYNQVSLMVEDGRITERSYDTSGNLLEEKVTVGTETRIDTFTYDAQGQMLTHDGPRTDISDVTQFDYDTYGNVTEIIDPLGRVTRMTYDIVGQLIEVESPNGVISEFDYDAAGNQILSDLDGEAIVMTYTSVDELETEAFPDGLVVSYEYDKFGRLTQTAENDGSRETLTLDDRGNALKAEMFSPSGALVETRSFEFDTLDRMTKEIGATGQVTLHEYDGNGNRIKTTDPLDRVTEFEYDGLNRMVKSIDPAGGESSYEYDALGHLVQSTDPLGHVTTYDVDGFGSLSGVSSPATGQTQSTFDAAGNLLSRTDARGVLTEYEYNALNLPTRILYADGTQETRAYTPGILDEDRLTRIDGPAGSLQMDYDPEGRIAERVQTVDGVSLTITWTYDADGRLQQMTYPSGRPIDFSYDATGRIAAISVNAQPLLDQATYRPLGRVSGWVWGNGTAYSRTFNLDGILTAFPLGGVTQTLVPDAANRIQSISGSAAQTFGYDDLDRLTSYGGGGESLQYTYDANGNRQSVTDNGVTTTYAYDPSSSRLLSTTGGGSSSYSYDDAGNVTGDGNRSLFYDARGRLERAEVGGSATTYLYNGLGQRVAKGAAGGSAEEIYAYDDQGRLVGVYDGSGAPISETIYLDDLPVGLMDSAGSLHHVYSDQLGTPRAITDRQDKVLWSWISDPFGEAAPNQDVDGDQTDLVFNQRFPGQYYDEETDLHYNYFRDYDPELGRYLEGDPLGLDGGLNLYLYANANPLSFADPTGENPLAIRAIIARAFRELQRAIRKCKGNKVCRCRAIYAAYKYGPCKVGCSTCNTPGDFCCAVKKAQVAAAGACVTLRAAYIKAKCDKHIPTRVNHPGQLKQAQQALVNCQKKMDRVCKCPP